MSRSQPSKAELRQREREIDRIEDRWRDAPDRLHEFGEPARSEDLQASGLEPIYLGLWERWDGMVIANGMTELVPLAQQSQLAEAAEERIREGDRVIGTCESDLLVIPADPWEEGADVLLVDGDGQRGPYASTVERLVLAAMAEASVLFAEDGDIRESALDEETGDLDDRVRRRVLRRRLDFDPDSPLTRFELAQSLRAAGDLRAAERELRKVVDIAPSFAWGQFELARNRLDLCGEDDRQKHTAARGFMEAADRAENSQRRAYFLAWACRASDDSRRQELATEVLRIDPGFVSGQAELAKELEAEEDRAGALEAVVLGLAVSPRQLELIVSKRRLTETAGSTSAS